jgi:23S rRNA (uracil1939-C5)-methyltransferase
MNKQKELFGTNLEVVIERIVPNGFGIAFAESLTIFVSLAAIGDKAKIRINSKKGKLAFAEIVEIIEPSPFRVEPKCVYFGRCGGCDFQQMNYEAQLTAKVEIIKDCLKRIGKIDWQNEISIVASPNPFEYRSRASWHADTRTKKLGYYRRNSNAIFDIENCEILTPQLKETFANLRQNLNFAELWAEVLEIEAANAGENVSIYSNEIIEPTNEIFFETDEHRYFYNAETFFQGNQLLIPRLINDVLSDKSGKVALDLYCGVGLFSLPLAKRFEKVYAVEANAKSIEFAKKNVENARLTNVEIFNEDVKEWLDENKMSVDFVVFDPPRTGLEKEVISKILEIKPTKICYVSCEPSTLARDLKILTENGYQIDSITAYDLFPQTHHVETVVYLS